MAHKFEVVQRNPNSWHEDGTYELVATGGTHEELFHALVEADARTLEQGEGKLGWTVEQGGKAVSFEDMAACGDIEPLNVYDYLVDEMGMSHDDAERLVS